MLSFEYELPDGPLKTALAGALVLAIMSVGAFLLGAAKGDRASLPRGVGALFVIGGLWIAGETGGATLLGIAAALGIVFARAGRRNPLK